MWAITKSSKIIYVTRTFWKQNKTRTSSGKFKLNAFSTFSDKIYQLFGAVNLHHEKIALLCVLVIVTK